eukprot:gene50909-68137_t
MHPMINTAVKAARRAAAIINRASFDIDQLRVTHKSHNDFVTEVDQAAERPLPAQFAGIHGRHIDVDVHRRSRRSVGA